MQLIVDTVDIVDTAGGRHNKSGKKGRFCNFSQQWKKRGADTKNPHL